MVVGQRQPSRQSQRTILAIAKLMRLDEEVAVSTNTQLTNEKMLEQTKSLIEMSTPVTAIGDGILMLPLIGIIDSKRALDTTPQVLEEITCSQARCLVS